MPNKQSLASQSPGKQISKSANLERGQSLFEIVVALAISALIIITVVSLVTVSIKSSTFSKNQTLAASYAQEVTEWLRGQRDTNIATFITRAGTDVSPKYWCMPDLGFDTNRHCSKTDPVDKITQTMFVREVKIAWHTDITSGKMIIKAEVTVTWTDSLGTHTFNSATTFTDWRQI